MNLDNLTPREWVIGLSKGVAGSVGVAIVFAILFRMFGLLSAMLVMTLIIVLRAPYTVHE